MKYAIPILLLAALLGSCIAGPPVAKNENGIYGAWIGLPKYAQIIMIGNIVSTIARSNPIEGIVFD